MVDEYGLGRFLDEGTNNVTILAPTNEVLDEDDIPNNQKVQWLSYHIAQGAWEPHDLNDHMLLKTEYNSTQLRNESQRLLVTVENNRNNVKETDRSAILKSIRFGDHSRVVGDDSKLNQNRFIATLLYSNRVTFSVYWWKCYISYIRSINTSNGHI